MKNKILIVALASAFVLGACGPDEDDDLLQQAAEIQEMYDGEHCAAVAGYIGAGNVLTPTQGTAYSMGCLGGSSN